MRKFILPQTRYVPVRCVAFGARIAEHNRSCCIAAPLSLTCAVVCLDGRRSLWMRAESSFLKLTPQKHMLSAIVLSRGILCDRSILSRRHRRPSTRALQAPPDRSIIGWHLIADVLLLPARATLLVWDHLNARIALSRTEREEAWRLMRTISKMRRADRSLLAGEFPASARLAKMLEALQFAGWIGLYRGEEDWYYRIRSDQSESSTRS